MKMETPGYVEDDRINQLFIIFTNLSDELGRLKQSMYHLECRLDAITEKDADELDDAAAKSVPGFWIGPHGVRVPDDIPSVISRDGVNYLTKTGFVSLVGSSRPHPSRDEYLKEYADLGNDGYYYYKPEKGLKYG